MDIGDLPRIEDDLDFFETKPDEDIIDQDDQPLLLHEETKIESIEKLQLSMPSEMKHSASQGKPVDPLAKGSSIEMS